MLPDSSSLLDDKIENFLANCPSDNYLDIGTGRGKFGKMIKGLYPKARVVGIEPDKNVIDKCKLKKIYSEVIQAKANDLIHRCPDFKAGIVIMGDIIEHLKKSEGVDFLSFILYRCEYLIIKFPPAYLQFGIPNPSDAHISFWYPEDFESLHCPIITNYQEDFMHLTIVQGCLGLLKEHLEGHPEQKEINELPKEIKYI